MEGSRMDQVPLSSRELGNLMVTSGLFDCALAKLDELQGDQTASPVCFRCRDYYDERRKRTIVAFVCSPERPSGQGDFVPSDEFNFLSTDSRSVSINGDALKLFSSWEDRQALTDKLTKSEGQLIIAGKHLAGSVASLFTLSLLNLKDKKSKFRPLCITFGSPVAGDFDLRHSQWNSLFFHVVSNQDPAPGLSLPSSRSASSSSDSQTAAVYKPFGTYVFCSELGCACFDDPDFVLKLLKAISSEAAGGSSEDPDYLKTIRNLKERAIRKGDQISAGIITDLEIIGFNQTRRVQHHININNNNVHVLSTTEARNSAQKKLNEIKIGMAYLEWYKKKSKDLNIGYYDCYRNQPDQRDFKVEEFKAPLTEYWKDMVEQVQRKPQKEGAAFRTSWHQAGTTYRRMAEPMDIAAFYREGKTGYMNEGRSPHYKLLEKWYEEDKNKKPLSQAELDSKKEKVSALLTSDSCFWARVEEAILSCKSLSDLNSTPEQTDPWANLVEFEKYVMKEIDNYDVSPEIFLEKSSFMKWWRVYNDYIQNSSNSHTSRLIDYMKKKEYWRYG